MRALAIAVALAWALTAAHLGLPDASPAVAAFHATAGWWGAITAAPLLGALALRRWRIAAAIPVLAWIGQILPGTLVGGAAQPHRLRIASANVLMVNPTPDALLAEVFAEDPDVVVLQEYSPPFAAAAAPYRLTHPFGFERPETHSFGSAVFSRLPLDDLAETEVAGVSVPEFTVAGVRVLVVHTLPPINDAQVVAWRAQLAWLAERTAGDPRPLVVAGDLNATRHHPSFRRLLRTRLRDAHAEVGRGAALTWPTAFPLLRLDHLLLAGPVEAVAVWEGRGTGSDHRPVFADLR
jgi:endonuclease/exonuclease/phosphatase (EEP) superfamily protein YafD